jgi:hypothetical protein
MDSLPPRLVAFRGRARAGARHRYRVRDLDRDVTAWYWRAWNARKATRSLMLRHRVNMAHCIVTGHVVPWGPCPRCERRALG